LFTYPDEGFVAYRSLDEEGSVLAVDLRSGKKLWEHATPVSVVWTDGPHIRLLTGSSLWTVVARTGEVVRRDAMPDLGKARAHALPKEGVFIAWKHRQLEAFSLPPPPPAEPAPPKPLWSFESAGGVLEGCIKVKSCDINWVGPDRLLVDSAGHLELVRITTGERLWDIKRSVLMARTKVSPDLSFVANPKGDELVVFDGASGKEIHVIPYPKGDEGSNLSKYARWLTNDVVITVFPTKEGAPRRMSAFSASQGKLLWTVVLPDAPDFKLTSEQRGMLFGRILLSLVMTAASVSNPMSVGGANYAVVVVPSLDVSSSLSADSTMARGEAEQGNRTDLPFAEAAARVAAVRSKTSVEGPGRAHYVVGEGERFEVLEIDRRTGDLRATVRYEAPKVHSIVPFTAFDRALSIESDNRRVRILSLAPRPATSP
jgi:hypothetical protein